MSAVAFIFLFVHSITQYLSSSSSSSFPVPSFHFLRLSVASITLSSTELSSSSGCVRTLHMKYFPFDLSYFVFFTFKSAGHAISHVLVSTRRYIPYIACYYDDLYLLMTILADILLSFFTQPRLMLTSIH